MNQSHSDNMNTVTISTRLPVESIYSEGVLDLTLPQDTQTSTLSSYDDDTNEPSSCTKAEHELRRKILNVQRNSVLSAKDKARQIQKLMWKGTQSTSNHISCNETATSEGYSITYQDKEQNIMGCSHYQRKCKLQAHCCGKLFPCRFCHDEASDHGIVRTDTKNMYCMLCDTLQPAAQTCMKCDEQMAHYYCNKCKLWDDAPSKLVYHCDDCGICRQGRGLGKDFFHCHKCNICMSMSMLDKHRCIERNLESDCPICGEYMFTSTTTVIFMPCGHCIHKHCYGEYIQTSYQCPTCLKSLGDMSDYFARLDRELERQSMPAEYANFISHIFCNDCEMRCSAKYHFFYHKCAHCSSYNTSVLRTENTATNNTDTTDTPSSPSSSSSSSSASQLSSSPTSPDEMSSLVVPDAGLEIDHMNGVERADGNTIPQELEDSII